MCYCFCTVGLFISVYIRSLYFFLPNMNSVYLLIYSSDSSPPLRTFPKPQHHFFLPPLRSNVNKHKTEGTTSVPVVISVSTLLPNYFTLSTKQGGSTEVGYICRSWELVLDSAMHPSCKSVSVYVQWFSVLLFFYIACCWYTNLLDMELGLCPSVPSQSEWEGGTWKNHTLTVFALCRSLWSLMPSC